MATFIITVDDEIAPSLTGLTSAVLELVEPGSAGHCRAIFDVPHTRDRVESHVGLGVTVREIR